jgi:hypothetical protein
MALTQTLLSPYPRRWSNVLEYREWRARALTAAAARREAWRRYRSRSTKWLTRELGMHQFHMADDCAPYRSGSPRSLSLWYIRMIENELQRREQGAGNARGKRGWTCFSAGAEALES